MGKSHHLIVIVIKIVLCITMKKKNQCQRPFHNYKAGIDQLCLMSICQTDNYPIDTPQLLLHGFLPQYGVRISGLLRKANGGASADVLLRYSLKSVCDRSP